MEGRVILQDVHAGVFWPTAVSNVDSIVRRCEGCLFFVRQKHVSSHQLQTIHITWPFSTWGMALVGPFKKAKGGFKHIFVVVDKFTKWIEVKPAASITAAKVVEFIREIMYRFGIPNNIISDNGTQFTTREFKDFCVDSGIKINYASVSHLQSNSQVDRSNDMILQGLKSRIFNRIKPYAGEWVNDLPSVLWALHTTPNHAMGHTPFSLVYGSEAILPMEVEHKSFRVQHFNEE
jgi:transposase InsO family protein